MTSLTEVLDSSMSRPASATKFIVKYPDDYEVIGFAEMLELKITGVEWEEQQREERDFMERMREHGSETTPR